MTALTDTATTASASASSTPGLSRALGALYGAVAIAPLFVLRAAFSGSSAPAPETVVGVVSLLVWTVLLIVPLQHMAIALRASFEGEGGTMALLALARRAVGRSARLRQFAAALGLVGVALLVSQAVLLPALSAAAVSEGLHQMRPDLLGNATRWALIFVVIVFLLQGNALPRSSRWFGPTIAAWLVVIALLGAVAIAAEPSVLRALNPLHAARFLAHGGADAVAALAVAALTLSGVDALHVGLDEFDPGTIRRASGLALPALLLCYLGQGAALLADPGAVSQPFFRLVPHDWLPALALLAALVAAIATRTFLSALYGMLREAAQLGYLPRLNVTRSRDSAQKHLQLPGLNGWVMVLAAVSVLALHSPSRLSAAYALALATTVVTTAALLLIVARRQWRWNWLPIGLLWAVLAAVELPLLAGAIMQFGRGGWYALAIGAAVLGMMLIWHSGRTRLLARTSSDSLPIESFCSSIAAHKPKRVDGTAVFLTARPDYVPQALLGNLRYNHVLHRCNLILTVEVVDAPAVDAGERFELADLGNSFYRGCLRFGFAEAVNVPVWLGRSVPPEIQIDSSTSYFVGREVITEARPGARGLRATLFAAMARNAMSAHAYFRIPSGQLFEISRRWEL